MTGGAGAAAGRPRIGLWGVFDVDDPGQAAARLGIAAELRRIVPGADVIVRAPLGELHPLALDGGDPALPLAGADPAALAAEADAVLICGGGIGGLAAHLERLYGAALATPAAEGMARLLAGPGGPAPVSWVAVGLAPGQRRPAAMRPATVLDRRLASGGGGVAAEVVAHPALLLAGALDADRQALRLRFLEAVGRLPAARPVLAVEGDAGLLAAAGAVAAAVRGWAEAGGGTAVALGGAGTAGADGFAGALAAALGEGCHGIADALPVEDLAAAVGAAAGCVTAGAGTAALAAGLGVEVVGIGDDPTLAATLDALGLPAPVARRRIGAELPGRLARLGGGGGARVAGTADAARQRLTAALGDAVAGATAGGGAAAGDPAAALADARRRLEAAEAALRCRGRRPLEDRAAYLRLLAGHDEEMRGVRAEMAVLRAELERTRTTLETVLGSRTWKLTEPARELAERLRRRRR